MPCCRCRWLVVLAVGLGLGLGLCACGEQQGTGEVPSYAADVAPLLADNCVGCHQQGGIAPFELTTYAQVSALGSSIADAVSSRRMPPFLPDNSGDCATYADAMWLSDAEIETITAWAEGGVPEGEFEGEPPAPPEVKTLEDDATHEAYMPVAYTPDAALSDDYRCFVFDSDLPSDVPVFVQEYEVVPGETRVVHHVVVYQASDAAAAEQARALDEAEAGPGYSCFGAAGVSARMLMNWAPGTGITRHPEGTGVEIEPGLPLVVQMHYNLANGALPDQTRIRLKAASEVDHPITPWFLSDFSLNLPAGEEEVVKDIEMVFGRYAAIQPSVTPLTSTIMGVRAHMHGLGAAMRIERVDSNSGEVACLADIPRYDFNWQRSYFLDQPVLLKPADPIRVRCVFDTTSRDTTTTWGEGTSDEMCLATFYTAAGDLTAEP